MFQQKLQKFANELEQRVIERTRELNAKKDELQKTQPERRVEFVIAEGVYAVGDTQMLRIVLDNLFSNAWKFTWKHPDARIEFGVTQVEGKTAYFVKDDAVLLLRELRRGGYDTSHERVDTPEAMSEALAGREWDIVISDYVMPRFSGLSALKLLQETGIDLPFIIVSGKIGEDIAVDAMKAGAHDYLMKGKFTKLAPTIERELHDAQVRREKRKAEAALRAREIQQTMIAQISNQALAGEDIPALMRRATSRIAATLNVEYCGIFELLPTGKSLVLLEGAGWKEGYLGDTIIMAGKESQAGYTLLIDELVIVEDYDKEQRFTPSSLILEHGAVSGLCVKIGGKDTPFGVLSAHTSRKRKFNEYDISLTHSRE
ncbi:MAG: response regulator [Euryarchaeota archaeon]|nr:response regulator [Euryarchaeota archaeon]MBU4340142.1 response regulator [Euryarchaeota archaeon]MBU4453608.1 response regulator [Euryarchaeota archaeon]MCG2737873.1 response regulator [Candidatus Methanoperedenaceae archaeon]